MAREVRACSVYVLLSRPSTPWGLLCSASSCGINKNLKVCQHQERSRKPTKPQFTSGVIMRGRKMFRSSIHTKPSESASGSSFSECVVYAD